MTQENIELIAAAIKSLPDHKLANLDPVAVRRDITEALAVALTETNSRFNAPRFYKACGSSQLS